MAQENEFSLSWEKVNVEILEKQKRFWKTTNNKRKIIHNFSGQAKSSSLVAIMGPSGSGKTTFLTAISGRSSDKTGTIKINNIPVSDDTIKNISGFVYQQDIFTETLTVLEQLRFIVGLKLKPQEPYTIIKKMLLEFSLELIKDNQIKTLSGGEKRRLSLAGELICNPLILFCDEPTTGLDSYSAMMVVQKLQTVALSGKIVVAVIHQPSSQLFHYFNNVMLLAEGELVFQGIKEAANHFFESMDFICPPTYNPADFYIKCLTYEDIRKMTEKFQNQICANKAEDYNTTDNSKCKIIQNGSSKNKNSLFYELKWLLWRNFKDMTRDKASYIGGYFCVVLEFLVVTQIFGSVLVTSNHSAQDIEGMFYYVISEIAFTNMYAVITVFPKELAIFLREKNMYSVYPYFMSKIFSLVPLCIFSCITYTCILFTFLKFLDGFYLWLKITFLFFLIAISSCSIGLAFSATFTTVLHIEMIMAPFELMLILMSGYFVKTDTSGLFSWLKYMSPFYYGFSSVSNIFWRDITGHCTANKNISCSDNGLEVLQHYGFYKTYDVVAFNILYLHILTIIFCLIGFAGILRKKLLYSI